MGTKEMMCDCYSVHPECVEQVKKECVAGEKLARVCNLYKLFADSTRLSILAALNCREMCVCDIAVLLDMTKSAVSHQLKVLRENNLVKYRKDGKHSYYTLADEHVKDILDIALEHINEDAEEDGE